MVLREVGESFGNAFENKRRRGFELTRGSFDIVDDFAARHAARELYIGILKRTAEAAHTVPVLSNIAALGLVQDVADVFSRVAQMLELGNEMADRLLEVDVVFPKRVIGIDQYCMSRHASSPAANLSPRCLAELGRSGPPELRFVGGLRSGISRRA